MTDIQPPLILGDSGDSGIVPFAISVTDDQVIDAIGAFLTLVLPNVENMRGQDNRVPEPLSKNFVIITPRRRLQLSTTRHENSPVDGIVQIDRATQADFQLDVYGPKSTDNAQVITTLFRDAYGCEVMAGTGVQPLFCDDGRQMPLVNGEEQYEDRWMIQASVQINPSISTPTQFTDSVAVVIEKAD